uniref:Translation elongation factor EFTu/EF1A C-terminal domain-containing protein n=1 Tax=Ditylenchus dipsaci TaxID=166011 RepID=A0A915D5Q0_9BILA
MFSQTWDTAASIKIVGKDFIMPGEHGEVEVSLGPTMFMEPQQRFTLRKEATTIATGVFTEVLPRQTEEEKDKKFMKKAMKAEMERLGFNPYQASQEKRCKPDYTNSVKNEEMAEKFAELMEKEHNYMKK